MKRKDVKSQDEHIPNKEKLETIEKVKKIKNGPNPGKTYFDVSALTEELLSGK